ncbi:PREDICTED: gastric intrinsic factor-like, partial [Merops nubicus]|uniref:gastric intrinsic factor-like n=1 Tax=Merops nubicus TaxID=57421 RepID=UPI0004F0319A
TSLYQLSLGTLALCLVQTGSYEEASEAVAKKILNPESFLSVDTRAMAVVAMTCTYHHTDLGGLRELLQKTLSTVTNGFLDQQERTGGMIGNISSMGLAMQALQVTKEFYAPREWDCAQAFAVVQRHDYQQPVAIAQVLPILVGKTYLDVRSLGRFTST